MKTRAEHGFYRLRLLDGWRALLVCFLTGALSALAFAPFEYWFVLPVALPLFYVLLEAAAARRHALLRGFAFGYGCFMAGTWWIANALLVDAEKFGWLLPISIGGLSAVMALWFALFGWLVWWRRSGHAYCDVLRFMVLWVAIEYLRTLGMFGFPWNLLGYAAFASGRVVQLASLVGPYGLSFLLLALALLPVVWARPGIGERARMAHSAMALIALIAAYGYGMARTPADAAMTQTRLRVVQPNIPQSQKWTQDGRIASLRIHDELTHLRTDAPLPDVVVWSETAMPFTVYQDSEWPARLASMAPPNGVLLTGAVRANDSVTPRKVWNSLIAIDATGELRGSYDKHQLVPFGEFVPLRNVLPLDKITPGDTDFSRGAGPSTLRIAQVPPFSALICYEIIFPWISVAKADRPDWILNVTNDAWYGDSPGPYQHFAMTRMRAIEQGLPVVRAANTGISAVIDPYGRAVRQLPLGTRGVIDQALPKPLMQTLYARVGETLVLLLLTMVWLFTTLCLRLKKA